MKSLAGQLPPNQCMQPTHFLLRSKCAAELNVAWPPEPWETVKWLNGHLPFDGGKTR